ncbi:MAG: ubiquinone/menaquinone biosynthesis methyltransferase [Veillonellaceae bacterium]|nr:ubiquinone/menaquinone biosynthesis methyltransferase [Veillonellaceae bacterium]
MALSNMNFSNHEEKEEFVQGVFSSISNQYDLMNTVLSFNQDKFWRKFAIKRLRTRPNDRLLDVACGTGMLTIEALRRQPTAHVEALDFNQAMLNKGVQRFSEAGVLDRVHPVQGDAMDLPYEDNSFDGAMSAFALRNVPDVETVLREMYRVVKRGRRVVTLELAKPTDPLFKKAYYAYFEKILPVLGRFSRDNSAYSWLPESLRRYPHQSKIQELYTKIGFQDATYYELSGGIVAVHVGIVGE